MALVLCTACKFPPKARPEGSRFSSSAQPAEAPVADSQPPASQPAESVARREFQNAAWPVPESAAPQQYNSSPPFNTQQGWPAADVGVSAGPPANNPLLQQEANSVYDPTVTVATIGDLYVLRGDLIGEANVMLAPGVEKLPPEQLETQRAQILVTRDKMAKQLLNQTIERKLMYLEFLRGIPEEKRAEAEANIKERIGSAFNTELEEMVEKVRKSDEDGYPELAREDVNIFRLALLMKQQQMVTTIQLDNYLRRYGTSLDKQRQAFAERTLGRQALVSGIETKPEVTHIEMLEYYNNRLEEFQVADRSKWEQLTARFDRFNSKEECRAAINAMGSEVWLGGAPFDAVAKRSSHGTNADQGGFHDWTDRGNLEISREIQQAVFSFPPGELSPIIEDAEGFHIIRVIERVDAHVTSFADAQASIKKTLQAEKRNADIAKFMAKMRKQIPIWTIYDAADEDQQRVANPSPRADSSFPR